MGTDEESTEMTPEDRRVSSGLRQAASWARGLTWELEPSDVMTRSFRGGVQARGHGGIRLSHRIIWVAVIVAAIVVVITVPELSTHHVAGTKPPGTTGDTRTSTPGTELGGAGAPCKTEVPGVASTPLGPLELPERPGPIIGRARAVSIARSAIDDTRVTPLPPKLSSWTEVKEVLESTGWNDEKVILATPTWVADFPWTPAWVVVFPAHYSSAPKRSGYAVLVDAAPGSPKTYVLPGLGQDNSWYNAMTDRDPSLGGCPGGSSARVPFGVLTRDEEEFTQGRSTPLKTIVLKLTTVPALYAADPGLFGGCVRASCTLDELVWPLIEIVHAPAGHTIPYAPRSTPAGYRPKQVKEYFTISAATGGESGPGPLPAAVANLMDLAPPGN
jgi:hypothetical protein